VAFAMSEVAVLGAEGDWPGAVERARSGLASASDPVSRASLAAWASVSCVYAKGDLAEAESFCNESMSVVPWEGEVQTVRAVVTLAQGRDDEAGQFLKGARIRQCGWAAKAAGAHAWAELYRRKGDRPAEARWRRRAKALDPANIFAWPDADRADRPPAASASTEPAATRTEPPAVSVA